MNRLPAISIIVPIYKVEKYLNRCIDSILAQSFTDYELILVDDGSPDNCPDICDDYVNQDSRIKVIHKENGGLSDARNAGIALAQGEFLGFVDSDDYIEPDMYETLYNDINHFNADISICDFTIVTENEIKKYVSKNVHWSMTGNEAVYYLIGKNLFTVNVWNKLYRKSLFNNIRYPNNCLYEDFHIMYKLLYKANVVVYNSVSKYNYFQRSNSIMGKTLSMPIGKDKIKALEEMTTFFQNCNIENKNEILIGIAKYLLNDIYKMIGHNTLTSNTLYLFYGKSFAKKIYTLIKYDKNFSAKQRIVLKTFIIFPPILETYYRISKGRKVL